MSLAIKIITITGVLSLILLSLYLVPSAGTDGSHVLRWEKVSQSPIFDAASYTNIYFFDKQNGIALTLSSIEATRDGGKTWERIQSFQDSVLSSLVVKNKEIWLVGEEYTDKERSRASIWKAGDKALKFERVAFDSESLRQVNETFSDIDQMCFDQNGKAWLVGDGGVIEASVGDNKVNVLNFFETKEELQRIFCDRSGTVWVTGRGGAVGYYARNEWSYKSLGNDKSFTKIIVNGDWLWLVGSSITTSEPSKGARAKGLLFRSKDRGSTWEDMTPAEADGLVDIYFENRNGWVVGLKGGIYSTVDGGETWVKHQAPTSNNLLTIFFLDSKTGWIAGDQQVFLKSQD